MSGQELEVVSIIAKTLKAKLPSVPMNLATKYAKKIWEDLRDEGWILIWGK